MAGLMQGHEVKLLREGHRASPTHGTTASSIQGAAVLPRAPGLHHSWPVDAAGLFLLPGVHHSPITSPSLQAVAGTALGRSALRSITHISLPFAW